MTEYSYIDSPGLMDRLCLSFEERGIDCVAMDFEEESNLHVYGEHLCLVQLSDGSSFYLIDALVLCRTEEGRQSLKAFLEGPVTKIMFDCSSDSAIARKALGIVLQNVYDIRLVARALGFEGNLSALTQRNLGIEVSAQGDKKKYQRANWMKRPLPQDQLEYALDDVKYLFQLKESLQKEAEEKLPLSVRRRLENQMKHCSFPKHKDRPGWEKICNYRALPYNQKVYIRHFFIARDNLARKANVPATFILDKHLIVAMAKSGTWETVLEGNTLRYKDSFENARLAAEKELADKKGKK